MKNKFYTVEKDIGGIHYVAQFNGISAMFRAVDESYVSEDSKNISVEKLSKYIFENVIVEPKGLTIDDFDTVDDFNEVIKWAQDVMKGKFRPKEEKQK